jgi:hypothetical protein
VGGGGWKMDKILKLKMGQIARPNRCQYSFGLFEKKTITL